MTCVLVTGGTGSIGSALVERLLNDKNDVHHVIVLSRNDSRQHELKNRLRDSRLSFILGDIRDPDIVEQAMAWAPDMVFHCAAVKHVWAAEENAVEAADINVKGTRTVLQAFSRMAHLSDAHDKVFVLLSTDKAAAPTSIMGMTKLMAESVLRAETSAGDVRKGIVRFGNILGSSGSVIPTWTNAIKEGKPILVTNWAVTRYVMTPEGAAQALLDTAEMATYSDVPIFCPRMNAVSLQGLFYELCRKLGVPVADVQTTFIGLQRGEKKHEACISSEEVRDVYEVFEKGLVLRPSGTGEDAVIYLKNGGAFTEEVRPFLSSQYAPRMEGSKE